MANLFDSLQSSSYKRENRGEKKVLEIDNNCELNLLVAVEQISEVFEDSLRDCILHHNRQLFTQ